MRSKSFLDSVGTESIILGFVAIIIFIVLLVCLFPYHVEMTVGARSWSSDVAVERWQQNIHEGWDVPQSGVIIKSERIKRSSTNICSGDEKHKVCTSVPNYDDWYTYSIWEWTTTRHIISAGTDNPHWGDMTDINDQDPVNPERFGTRSITFRAMFIDQDGNTLGWSGSQLEWDAFETGVKVRITRNLVGSLYSVERIR